MSRFKNLIRLVNFYPPLFFAGIKVIEKSDDYTYFMVQLKMYSLNRNLFGTHFGGSLYSMCDPFYAFILLMNLGDKYIVWDKSAQIEFIKPAAGKVRAEFRITKEQLAVIKKEVDSEIKKTYEFRTKIVNEKGVTIAEVSKEIYIRLKG